MDGWCNPPTTSRAVRRSNDRVFGRGSRSHVPRRQKTMNKNKKEKKKSQKRMPSDRSIADGSAPTLDVPRSATINPPKQLLQYGYTTELNPNVRSIRPGRPHRGWHGHIPGGKHPKSRKKKKVRKKERKRLKKSVRSEGIPSLTEAPKAW
ncbi:hypothetical protein LX36DRAFT_102926 [Colletotrichum falcatum]|nr:hypothetical protein LX36DRAFT_102926 [Colletotrichum falcatum]